MWVWIKEKTENDLVKLLFKKVYNFRPGYIQPTKWLKNTLFYYKYLSSLYPVIPTVFPNHVSTLRELALAMINAATKEFRKLIMEVKEIVALTKE